MPCVTCVLRKGVKKKTQNIDLTSCQDRHDSLAKITSVSIASPTTPSTASVIPLHLRILHPSIAEKVLHAMMLLFLEAEVVCHVRSGNLNSILPIWYIAISEKQYLLLGNQKK